MSHYSVEGAQHYEAHHKKNLRTRITTFRERQLLATALKGTGRQDVIMDIPCGTGRFWPVLFASGADRLIAADNSDGMLKVARDSAPQWADRLTLLNTSIFELDLPNDAVDCISCMRFFHHLALREERLRALRELHRVTRRHLLVSLWVDGNWQSRRRLRHDAKHTPVSGYGPRRCLARADIEADFQAAGFSIERHLDVAPGWSMWRLYVLSKT